MKVRLHEYSQSEEFYARFIQIQSSENTVLVFNYEGNITPSPRARELAEKIARLMGDEIEWFEGSDMAWDNKEE